MAEAPAPAPEPLTEVSHEGMAVAKPRLLLIPNFQQTSDTHNTTAWSAWLKHTADDYRSQGFDVVVADKDAQTLNADSLGDLISTNNSQAVVVFVESRNNKKLDEECNVIGRLKQMLGESCVNIPYAIDLAHGPCYLGMRARVDQHYHTNGDDHSTACAAIAVFFQKMLTGSDQNQARIAAQGALAGTTMPR